MITLDEFLSYANLGLPVLYYLVTLLQQGFGKWHRWIARNARAYTLIFHYSLSTFFVAGMLGTLILVYPNVIHSLDGFNIDVRELMHRWNIKGDVKTLTRLLVILRILGFWFLFLGVCAATLGRREVFYDVRKAIHYSVHQRCSMHAATYTAHGRSALWETCVSKYGDIDKEEWETAIREMHKSLLTLDEVFRKSRQGENVRVVIEVGEKSFHYWRFGAHAYLVARPRAGNDLTGSMWLLLWRMLVKRNGDKEFRALVSSIRAITSVHGA